MPFCCVYGCENRGFSGRKVKYFNIPAGSRPFQAKRRRLWLQALQQVNGSTDGNKEPSLDFDSPDFVPSVFTCAKLRPRKEVERFEGRRKSLRLNANVDTQPRVDSPVDLDSSDLMEETETPSTPSVPKEGETSPKQTETETTPIKSQPTSSPYKAPLSFKAQTGILDKGSPIVLLKRVYVPASGYQCDECNQNFTNTSQLLKHKQLHEEEISFVCENCGTIFTTQADFTEHQCVPEPSFPCNMCDRSFTTSHNLKRHKLLHVKDGRKCHKCGVLFCQRHNHILFQPLADSVTEYEEDPTNIEPQNVFSDLMPEIHLLVNLEPSQTADLDENAQSTVTVAPGPLLKTSSPALHTEIPVLNIPVPNDPVPVFRKPVPVSLPASVPRISNYPGTSSEFKPPLPKYPKTFAEPLLPKRQEHPPSLYLPPKLKLFSPQYLTSALLEVKRNYEYILSKPRDVKRNLVKEEPCELPLIPPDEQSVKHIKRESTAYDLEVML